MRKYRFGFKYWLAALLVVFVVGCGQETVSLPGVVSVTPLQGATGVVAGTTIAPSASSIATREADMGLSGIQPWDATRRKTLLCGEIQQSEFTTCAGSAVRHPPSDVQGLHHARSRLGICRLGCGVIRRPQPDEKGSF
jgi:hypothetical protein